MTDLEQAEMDRLSVRTEGTLSATEQARLDELTDLDEERKIGDDWAEA